MIEAAAIVSGAALAAVWRVCVTVDRRRAEAERIAAMERRLGELSERVADAETKAIEAHRAINLRKGRV